MSHLEIPLHISTGHHAPDGEVIPVDIGLPSNLLDRCYAPQREFQWCWAAVMQTVLAVHEIDLDQATIVEETFGRSENGELPDLPASLSEITANLNRIAESSRDGMRRIVQAELHPEADLNRIRDELCWRNPVILGLAADGAVGHAVLCTGIRYDNATAAVMEIIVRDPSPVSPTRGRRALTGAEARQIVAMWTVRARHWPERI